MKSKLFVAVLAVAVLCAGGCGNDNPAEPNKPLDRVCPTLTISPIVVHMKVDDTQTFTAKGGDPAMQYSFGFERSIDAAYGSLSADSVAGTAIFAAVCRTGEVPCSPGSGGAMTDSVLVRVTNMCGDNVLQVRAEVFISSR